MGDDIIIYGMFQYRMQQIFQICLTKIPRLLEKDFLVKYLGINSTADATTLTQINLICNCKSSGIFIYIFQRLHDMIKTFIFGFMFKIEIVFNVKFHFGGQRCVTESQYNREGYFLSVHMLLYQIRYTTNKKKSDFILMSFYVFFFMIFIIFPGNTQGFAESC